MNRFKNDLTITGLLFLSIFFTRCSKQLGEVEPKNQIAQSSLTNSDISKLRIGMYSGMENMQFTYYFDFDVRGENFRGGPGFSLIDPVNMNPADARITALWQSAYQTLAKVNFLIQTIDKSVTSSGYASIKGEALYFRALIYYSLVTRWGGVPLLTERTYEVVPRSTEAEVWAQIKTDLQTAETLVPLFSDKYYVSVQAVQALAARVYLALGEKAAAITYADKVLTYAATSGKFALASDATGYASMLIAGTSSKELIFSFANNTASNKHPFYAGVNDVDPTWDYAPSLPLFTGLYSDKAVAKGDKRVTAVFSADNTRIIKFPNGKAGQQLVATTSADYIPINISRISEMYLIKGEAQGSGAAAEGTLSPYFAARYATPPTSGILTALTTTGFQDLLLDERRREFFGEGQRWYDVKRTGRSDLLTSLGGRSYLLYYPIPQTERDLAGYTQNDGY